MYVTEALVKQDLIIHLRREWLFCLSGQKLMTKGGVTLGKVPCHLSTNFVTQQNQCVAVALTGDVTLGNGPCHALLFHHKNNTL